MTEVFLLRHANAYDEFGYQEPDTPLRGSGPEQAKKLADRLTTCKIQVCYASPYARAQQTAKAFSDISKVKIITDDRLKEIGTTEWNEKDFAKAEDFVEDVIFEMASKNKDKRIAVFVHGNFIKALICKILNADFDSYNNKLVISLASITIIHLEDSGLVKVITVSDTAHEYLT